MAEARGHGDFKLVTKGWTGAIEGHNVTLPCHLSPETSASSMTIMWFKESECIYLYKNGQVIEGRGYEGRWTLNIQDLQKGNVSLIMRDYRERDKGVYICQVKHGEQEEEIALGLGFFGGHTKVAKAEAEAKAYLSKETAEQKNRRLNSAHVFDLQVLRTELEKSNRLLTEKGQELVESNEVLTKKGQELVDSNKVLTKKGQELVDSNKVLTKKGQKLDESNKVLTEKGQKLDESNKVLAKKGHELDESNKVLSKKGQELDESNKVLTKKGHELDESNKLLTENGQELVESNKVLTEKGQELDESNKLLTEKDQQLNQKDEELKKMKKEWDDVITENKPLAQQICDLKTELEKLRTESDQKTVGGETTDEDSSLSVRKRRRSKAEPPDTQQICDLKTELETLRNVSAQKPGASTAQQTQEEDKAAEEKLKCVRTEFVQRVSEATLNSLLDKLLQKNVINHGEMEAVTGERLRSDKARLLIDMVKTKGDKPCLQMIDMIHQLDPYLSEQLKLTTELRLMLLGRTGAGCAAGNTILGREEFGAETSSSKLSRRRVGKVCGRQLVLVDATVFSVEEKWTDVRSCLNLSAPGPHAFLLVLPAELSAGEVSGMMEKMQEVFGESCWEHSIVIFIHEGIMKDQSVKEFLKAGSKEHQKLVEKCGNRCHLLNITDSSHTGQVSQLLEKIESMVARNTESFYSTKTYQEAEALAREIQRDLEERRHMKEQEMRERFEKELKDSLRKMEGSIQELVGDIRKIDHRISELERQMREERDEERKRQLEEELRRESERREEMQRKLDRFRAERKNERREREERHMQAIEELRETYEAILMKVLLPEIQWKIMILITKMQREFNRQLGEKNRDMTTLRQRLKESHSLNSVLEEVYQDSLDKRLKLLGKLPSGSEREYL